jgi:DNA (cytosine-5)-methyltransferase 1
MSRASSSTRWRATCTATGDVIQGDIAATSPNRFDRPDLLWASPPCQPFSQAGLKLGLEDPRAHLIFQVPRWVKALMPRYVICEQVKQALHWWEAFAEEFEHLGYSTWTGVLSAEQYGVPQTRERAFLLASLDGSVTPPLPTHRKYHTRKPHLRPDDWYLESYVSMADVLDIDTTDLVGFPRRADNDDSVNGYRRRDLREGTEPAFTMTSKGRSWSINTGRNWQKGEDRTTAQQRDSEAPAPSLAGVASQWWLTGRQSKATARSEEHPAPTITAGHDVSQWQIGGRPLTPRDGLILQTFPPDCLDDVGVTKTAAFKAIGNAVPPLWAEKIARHLTGETHGN